MQLTKRYASINAAHQKRVMELVADGDMLKKSSAIVNEGEVVASIRTVGGDGIVPAGSVGVVKKVMGDFVLVLFNLLHKQEVVVAARHGHAVMLSVTIVCNVSDVAPIAENGEEAERAWRHQWSLWRK